ncbi:hypothetical protein L6164_010492 [Bauhinia variegata]|uniref:Uncharacterized protein n=1 Tax=Bauhinia variegata TaxID=167791 RepID=A0ACB9PND7_BAUVA|nr:hypothetical protein L6164_010492 [Bauhinia variegata]
MAEGNPQVPQELAGNEEQQHLKYLEFVQVATIEALVRFSILYAYAKERSGPLKPGVETVEGAVKSVVAPVYNKFHDTPAEMLRYVDRKVDESVTELDKHVPSNVKKVSAQGLRAVQMAPAAARTVVSDVRRAGVVDTASGLAKSVYSKCEPTAKVLYAKYEPKAEQCAVSTWRRLNKLPLFPHVANAVLPKAAYCTEKYNETVRSTSEKGYRVSAYLPLVPTEKIAKIFAGDEAQLPNSGPTQTGIAAH